MEALNIGMTIIMKLVIKKGQLLLKKNYNLKKKKLWLQIMNILKKKSKTKKL